MYFWEYENFARSFPQILVEFSVTGNLVMLRSKLRFPLMFEICLFANNGGLPTMYNQNIKNGSFVSLAIGGVIRSSKFHSSLMKATASIDV